MRDPVTVTRNVGRIRTIATVLLKHGLHDLVARTGLRRALSGFNRLLHRDARAPDPIPTPERLCRALEELGPTFVKLGQLFASRVDLFPPDWIAAFERLQDRLPAVPFAEIEAQLTEDLGAPPHTVFRGLDETPIAAASLAQVHAAVLPDGTDVVLKVRRPGMAESVARDLEILEWIGDVIERESPTLRSYRPARIARQFAKVLRDELDFRTECRHAAEVRRQLGAREDVVIPKTYETWSRERLNVQERIAGIRANDMTALDAAGLDRTVLARAGADVLLTMILDGGTFHADLHPGNVFFLPENRIAMIDFGAVGRLSPDRRDQLASMLAALIDRRAGDVVDVIEGWTVGAGSTDDLLADVEDMLERYHGVPLESLDSPQLLTDFTALLREHRLALPRDLLLLVKSLILVSALGRRLDPNFDVFAATAPMIRRAALARWSPDRIARRARRRAIETMNLLGQLPRDSRRVLAAASRGELGVKVELPDLDRFGQRIDRAIGRLTVGIVLAAIVVGSAIGMTRANQPTLWGIPILAYLGSAAAAAALLWLFVSFVRARH